jgi:hypothetical protein
MSQYIYGHVGYRMLEDVWLEDQSNSKATIPTYGQVLISCLYPTCRRRILNLELRGRLTQFDPQIRGAVFSVLDHIGLKYVYIYISDLQVKQYMYANVFLLINYYAILIEL